ncbi:MAG: amidohydrolase [Phycisphaerales bacterium]|nr:amidohydrolase [Phycisphaerales bacterium]
MTTMTNAEEAIGGMVADAAKHVTPIRHDLHQHPELMYEESRTSKRVCEELDALGVEYVPGLAGGTGVVAYLPASEAGGRTIGLRADMDALPIEEATGVPYTSVHKGVMHACGHDGHTSILLGAARVLKNAPQRKNNIIFVFQPAEEGGAGGRRMCEDGAIDGTRIGTKVDEMYGLHGWTELELGKLSTRNGPLLAATDEFDVTVKGQGGHAAEPHKCLDPVVVSAQIVSALQSIASRRVGPLDSVVLTVASIHAGHAHNVIPDEAKIRGTIRTLLPETRKLAQDEFRRITSGIASAMGASAEIEWHDGYPVTFNHDAPTERFRTIARAAIGDEHVIDEPHPTMGGEDFSYYGAHAPACFYLLGLAPKGQKYPRVHTPRFDFNDDAIPLGIEMMVRLGLGD